MVAPGIDQEKQEIRKRIWALLAREHAVPPGVEGTIPAFYGAEQAADRLDELAAWREARTVKAVPDRAQRPVRAKALREGKIVYMAVPRLAEEKPFYLLDPAALATSPDEAAAGTVAATIAEKVDVREMAPIDLIICGSVAVNRSGARLGKGAGYSDIEVALLQEAGLIRPETTIATTVHALQVVDGDLPEAMHDFRVDVILTQDEVIVCDSPRRPPAGLHWGGLGPEKIAAIPVLAARARGSGPAPG